MSNDKCRNGMPGCDCATERKESETEGRLREVVNRMVTSILEEDRQEIVAKMVEMVEAYNPEAGPVKASIEKGDTSEEEAGAVYGATKALVAVMGLMIKCKPIRSVSVHVPQSVEELEAIVGTAMGGEPVGDRRGH